jgi:hypothetical protein
VLASAHEKHTFLGSRDLIVVAEPIQSQIFCRLGGIAVRFKKASNDQPHYLAWNPEMVLLTDWAITGQFPEMIWIYLVQK